MPEIFILHKICNIFKMAFGGNLLNYSIFIYTEKYHFMSM